MHRQQMMNHWLKFRMHWKIWYLRDVTPGHHTYPNGVCEYWAYSPANIIDIVAKVNLFLTNNVVFYEFQTIKHSVHSIRRHWFDMQLLAGLWRNALPSRFDCIMFRKIECPRNGRMHHEYVECLCSEYTTFRLGRCTARWLFPIQSHIEVSAIYNIIEW